MRPPPKLAPPAMCVSKNGVTALRWHTGKRVFVPTLDKNLRRLAANMIVAQARSHEKAFVPAKTIRRMLSGLYPVPRIIHLSPQYSPLPLISCERPNDLSPFTCLGHFSPY